MALYFHVVQREDGQWACRHGQRDQDVHPTFEEALEHIRVLAAAQRPAKIFLHRLGQPAEHLEDL